MVVKPEEWVVMKDDPEDKCGWRKVTLYKNPKDDPYYDACVWHDKATEDNSWAEKNIRLEKVQEVFEQQVEEIQRDTKANALGRFYKLVTHFLTRFFWKGN